MTIISNSFAPACRQLLPKYTISTLQSVDIADNQDSYGYIYEIFSGFHLQDKHNASYFFQNVVTDRCLSYAKLIIIFWIKAITAYNNILLCLEN